VRAALAASGCRAAAISCRYDTPLQQYMRHARLPWLLGVSLGGKPQPCCRWSMQWLAK
jgi:hypothetical protein